MGRRWREGPGLEDSLVDGAGAGAPRRDEQKAGQALRPPSEGSAGVSTVGGTSVPQSV